MRQCFLVIIVLSRHALLHQYGSAISPTDRHYLTTLLHGIASAYFLKQVKYITLIAGHKHSPAKNPSTPQ